MHHKRLMLFSYSSVPLFWLLLGSGCGCCFFIASYKWGFSFPFIWPRLLISFGWIFLAACLSTLIENAFKWASQARTICSMLRGEKIFNIHCNYCWKQSHAFPLHNHRWKPSTSIVITVPNSQMHSHVGSVDENFVDRLKFMHLFL